jgi:LmbE family N-acetylglucosaminyl deacetylase
VTHFLYISPHFDDVALSCGGAVYEQCQRGEAVTVLTICAGTPDYHSLPPFALVQHRQWGNPRDPIATRRAEDAEALRRLGALGQYLDVLDCIYRRNAQGRPIIHSNRTLFGYGYDSDTELIKHIAQQIRKHIASKRDTHIVAPLAAGRHVDHLVTRDAVQQLLAQGYQVSWYEDFPYTEKQGAVTRARRQFGDSEWRMTITPIDVAQKIHAITAYTSQLKSTFNGQRDMATRVRAYARVVANQQGHAERVWQVASSK